MPAEELLALVQTAKLGCGGDIRSESTSLMNPISLPTVSSLIAAAMAFLLALGGPIRADQAFAEWLTQLRNDAEQRGISRATFDMATQGLVPDFSLPDLVVPDHPQKSATEPARSPADYLTGREFARLAPDGQRLFSTHSETLMAIEKRFGVAPEILVALWGRETGYRGRRAPYNVINALTTQAYLGRRKDNFREELLVGLKIIEDGRVKLTDLRGSSAGAMGLLNFSPSDFNSFGVDFDQDGKIDVWNSVPDALASAANRLVEYGWQRDKFWGVEVRVPPEFDCTDATPSNTKPLIEWLDLGMTPAAGSLISSIMLGDPAFLIQPAANYGPAFLVTDNFRVLARYGGSELYAIFVGHLADLIAGALPFEKAWAKLQPLQSRDLEEIQRRLPNRTPVSGQIDGATRVAIGRFQKEIAVPVDCWPSKALQDRLRRL
jgi:lytic murein transglycosylase